MKTKFLPLTFFITIISFAANAQWYAQAPMTIQRGQHGAVAHPNGNVYVWGGFANGGEYNTLEIFNYATNSWTSGAPIPAVTRGMAFTLGADSMIYSIGGFAGNHLSFVFKYDVNTNTWTSLAPIPAACWESAAATAPNGNIYVFGGENATSLVQVYNPVTDSWSTGAPMLINSMMHSAVTAPNGKIYVIGGYDGSILTSNRIYDPALDSWSFGAPMPNARNQFGSTLGPDGKIYIIGGKASYGNNQPPFFATVDIYDPIADSWATGIALPDAIGESEAVTINAGLNLIGGTNSNYLNTNYRLDLLCGTLSVTTSVSPNPICIGSNATLTATPGGGTPGYAYLWSTGATTQSITVSPVVTTSYTVTVTDDINCVITSQPVIVTVNPPLQAIVTGTTTICCNQPATVSSVATGGDGNYTYTWSPAIGTGPGPFTVTPCTTTTYSVIVNDSCGTPSDSASVTITVNPLPVLSLTSQDDTVCVNSTVNILTGIPAGGTYFGTGVGGNNFNAAIAGAGTHAVNYRFTDNNGCSDTITINIVVDLCTGVEALSMEAGGINIFPNPAMNEFRISDFGFRISVLEIFDVFGKKVFFQLKTLKTEPQLVVDVSGLSPGIYFVIIKDDNNNSVKRKFVKM